MLTVVVPLLGALAGLLTLVAMIGLWVACITRREPSPRLLATITAGMIIFLGCISISIAGGG